MENENTLENQNFRMKKKKEAKKKKKIILILIKVLLDLIKNELHNSQNINNHMSINTGLNLKNKFTRQKKKCKI